MVTSFNILMKLAVEMLLLLLMSIVSLLRVKVVALSHSVSMKLPTILDDTKLRIFKAINHELNLGLILVDKTILVLIF